MESFDEARLIYSLIPKRERRWNIMTKGDEKKGKAWVPAHQAIIKMLEKILTMSDSEACTIVKAVSWMYGNGGVKIPALDIRGLKDALRFWEERFPELKIDIQKALDNLDRQTMEANQQYAQKREKRKKGRIILEDAIEAIKKVVEAAEKDLENKAYGGPVSITIIGRDLKRIVSFSMDGVMPVSIGLDENKAYTAIIGQRATLKWEQAAQYEDLNGRDFTDSRWSNFGGGGPVIIDGEVIGAVGVSGRNSYNKDLPKDIPQDHELAMIGASFLARLYSLL